MTLMSAPKGIGGAIGLPAGERGPLAGGGGALRDKSDLHFRKTATEYGQERGIKWWSHAAE